MVMVQAEAVLQGWSRAGSVDRTGSWWVGIITCSLWVLGMQFREDGLGLPGQDRMVVGGDGQLLTAVHGDCAG